MIAYVWYYRFENIKKIEQYDNNDCEIDDFSIFVSNIPKVDDVKDSLRTYFSK